MPIYQRRLPEGPSPRTPLDLIRYGAQVPVTLTILPAILIFFARQRVIASRGVTHGVTAPRDVDAFVRHMQRAARRMLGKD